MNSGHRAEAIPEFESVLRVKPDWAEADNNLGILLANTPGRTQEALAPLRIRSPSGSATWHSRAA